MSLCSERHFASSAMFPPFCPTSISWEARAFNRDTDCWRGQRDGIHGGWKQKVDRSWMKEHILSQSLTKKFGMLVEKRGTGKGYVRFHTEWKGQWMAQFRITEDEPCCMKGMWSLLGWEPRDRMIWCLLHRWILGKRRWQKFVTMETSVESYWWLTEGVAECWAIRCMISPGAHRYRVQWTFESRFVDLVVAASNMHDYTATSAPELHKSNLATKIDSFSTWWIPWSRRKAWAKEQFCRIKRTGAESTYYHNAFVVAFRNLNCCSISAPRLRSIDLFLDFGGEYVRPLTSIRIWEP